MFPPLGGLDPRKMQVMLKQLGIKQEDVEADRVVIEGHDRLIVIERPSVQKIMMQGETSWQISGNVREEMRDILSEDDIALVMEKSGASRDEAARVLRETQDIAEAIVRLSKTSGLSTKGI